MVLIQQEPNMSESGRLFIFSCWLFDSLVYDVIKWDSQTNILI